MDIKLELKKKIGCFIYLRNSSIIMKFCIFKNITLRNTGFLKFEGKKKIEDSFFMFENNFYQQINMKIDLDYTFFELTGGFLGQFFNNTISSSILGTDFN